MCIFFLYNLRNYVYDFLKEYSFVELGLNSVSQLKILFKETIKLSIIFSCIIIIVVHLIRYHTSVLESTIFFRMADFLGKGNILSSNQVSQF